MRARKIYFSIHQFITHTYSICVYVDESYCCCYFISFFLFYRVARVRIHQGMYIIHSHRNMSSLVRCHQHHFCVAFWWLWHYFRRHHFEWYVHFMRFKTVHKNLLVWFSGVYFVVVFSFSFSSSTPHQTRFLLLLSFNCFFFLIESTTHATDTIHLKWNLWIFQLFDDYNDIRTECGTFMP